MNLLQIERKYKKTTAVAFLLLASTLAFAQEKIKIDSKIVDTQNKGVAYASITFSNSQDKLYSDAALSDDQGYFTLSLMPGKYEITVEAIDYKKQTYNRTISKSESLEPFSITIENSKTITPTKNIEGVIIQAQAPKAYRIELDKKVYDPSLDQISKGGTLQDVLANVPSVNVEADGSVSMRGNANIRFLINGKPSSILGISDDANALSAIPADQIDRIEVITNPSSKYEASGTAGILNIILKKNKGLGFNGSVESAVGYFPQSRLNTNLSWNLGKVSWFVNGGGGFGKNITVNKLFNDRFNTDKTYSDTKNDSRFENYNFNTGLNYNFTDNTSANFSITLNSSDRDGVNSTDLLIKDYAGIEKNARRIANTIGNNNSFQLDTGFENKIGDKGQILSASASYQNTKNNSSELVDDNSLFELVMQNITNNNKQNTWIAKADYELPIGEKSKLEAGARYDDNNNFTLNTLQDLLNNTNDAFFTNDTNYHERISAVYAQYKSKFNKIGYQLGLRNENTNINIIFSGYDPINNVPISNNKTVKNYSGFFPSAFLSYEISKNSQFSLNYARRINRPRSWQLIPSFRIQNAQNYFQGNADLNPSFVNSFEFAYNYSKGNKLTLNPTLYYQKL